MAQTNITLRNLALDPNLTGNDTKKMILKKPAEILCKNIISIYHFKNMMEVIISHLL